MELSKSDSQILNILLENSRLSFRQIAKKAGCSVATVLNHVKRLEKDGAIKGYSALLDYTSLGYEFEALIEMRVSKGKLFEVEKKIASNPNVCAVFDVTGHFDAVVLARFKSRKGLDAFLKKIQALDFVERTETKMILNTIKEAPLKV
ncbi:MAG: Lrp/AsnC family transcriptional regulator [Candidatus Diapherotrites archaeon]